MHSVKKSTVQLLFFFFLLIFVHLRILNICRFMMVFYFPFMISAQKLTNMRIMKENMRTGNLPANMKKNRVLQIIPCKKDGNLQNKSRLYCLTLCSQSHHVLVLCSIQLREFSGHFVNLILIWKLLCSPFRWLQQSHSLHETRSGVHRLHQCVFHRCKLILIT